MNNKYFNKKRLMLSIAWVAIGTVLWILSLTEKIPSDMWGGIGGGLIAVGIMQISKHIKYRTNEEYRKKTDISLNDERNRYIAVKAWSWTGYTVVIASSVLSLIFLALGEKDISRIMGFYVCAEILIYYISYIILKSKY